MIKSNQWYTYPHASYNVYVVKIRYRDAKRIKMKIQLWTKGGMLVETINNAVLSNDKWDTWKQI